VNVTRITKALKKLNKEGRKAFIPYVMAGDPSLARTKKLVLLLEDCGADIIELGVPFSDPLADGPTIQAAADRALKHGVTLRKVIAAVAEIRKKSKVPIVLMTYYNPVFRYGDKAFVRDAVKAGVDGVIVPDLPADEAGTLIKFSRQYGLDTIFLLAPTSTPRRIKLVAKYSTGFIYYVSITGITGAALKLDATQRKSIEAIRAITKKPVALGFGVSRPKEARAVAEFANGVIVGSAIVKKIKESPEGEVKRFVKSLRAAIR
jgi:tryptophan synthase alpha chain